MSGMRYYHSVVILLFLGVQFDSRIFPPTLLPSPLTHKPSHPHSYPHFHSDPHFHSFLHFIRHHYSCFYPCSTVILTFTLLATPTLTLTLTPTLILTHALTLTHPPLILIPLPSSYPSLFTYATLPSLLRNRFITTGNKT